MASGVPWRSTSTWRLLPGLPRSVGFGPISSAAAWSRAPPFSGHRGTVNARSRPVNPVGLTQPIQQGGVQPMPDTGRLPVPQAAPAGHSGTTAHLLRQVLPGNAGLQHEQDTGEGSAVRYLWAPRLQLVAAGRR